MDDGAAYAVFFAEREGIWYYSESCFTANRIDSANPIPNVLLRGQLRQQFRRDALVRKKLGTALNLQQWLVAAVAFVREDDGQHNRFQVGSLRLGTIGSLR